MFRRRRQGEEPEESPAAAEKQAEATSTEAGDDTSTGQGTGGGTKPQAEGGPWDGDESYPELDRIDFGALLVPIGPGLEIQVNFEATEVDAEGNPVNGRMVAVTVVTGESGLQLQAFAAPKRSGIWEEVRKETAAEITEAGGRTEDGEGPFGPELRAFVPVQVPEEIMDQMPQEIKDQGFAWQPVRFIGVDGPRWFLRAVVSGAAIEDEEQWQVLEDVFRNVVVVRGEQPMPPRELLELTLPADAQEALEQETESDGKDDFNPFERGPEITEVR